MPEQSEAEKRKITLATVLQDEIAFSGNRASLNHYTALVLMVLAVGSSVAAAILGLSEIGSKRLIGVIAALPALIAYVAITLKLEPKSSWHYHKYITLRILLSRLNFELSDPITVEEVAGISKERNKFNEEMRMEHDRELSSDFPGVGKRNGFTPQSNGSSGVQGPGPQGPAAGAP